MISASTGLPWPAPRVFALTLNWNGRKWLGECLSSLLEMDYPNYEVVMIDNGSSDDSVSFVREDFPTVHVVENRANLGYARGFNRGLEFAAARGADFFLILNNDTRIDAHALSALVQTALTQEQVGFVTGKVYFHDRPSVLQTVGKTEHAVLWNGSHVGGNEEDCGQHDQLAERPFLDDIFTLVSRQLYDETGGYDPQFFLQGEEFDWQARAKKTGWRFYYTPEAKLWHHGSLSMGGLGSPISEYFYVRNHFVVLAKHKGAWWALRYCFHVGYERSRSALAGILKRAPNLRSRFAGLLGLVAGILWLIHRRPATGVPWLIRAFA